ISSPIWRVRWKLRRHRRNVAPDWEWVFWETARIGWPISRPGRSSIIRKSWWTRHAAEFGSFIIATRSEEHTSELQSLMRISYAGFCLTKTKHQINDSILP